MSQPQQAIALHYDGKHSPTITASAQGEAAEAIVELAKEFNIPIYQNKELVALLATLELQQEVPEHLYQVIAEVLAFAFKLSGKIPPNFSENTQTTYKDINPYK